MGCCCCESHSFFVIFLKHFFDLGYSCGSIISELLEVIKTFQRITASVSFRTRFSPKCMKMFNWALIAIDAITGASFTSPFSEIEYFQIYTLIIPVTILTFLLRLVLPVRYFLLTLLPSGCLLMAGAGIGFIGVNNKIGISLTVAVFFGFALMIPIMLNRIDFSYFFTIILIAISGIILIFSLIVCYCCEDYNDKDVGIKVIQFLYAIIQLLIVPSTEHFIELQESSYKNDWRLIISFIALSLIIPLLITFLDISFGGESSNGKYKTDSWVKYVALIDIIKQIIYAIFAGFDITWGCLIIELVWGVFLLVVRPFSRFCEYFIEVGNSLVMIAANATILYSIYHNSEIYSLDVAIPLIVIAFIPAIVAMYIYFIFDFGKETEYVPDGTVLVMKLASLLMCPISWLFYGINLSVIDKKVYKIL